jgi:hypothetical protein
LKSGLEPQLVVVTSSLAPKHLDALFLLLSGHGVPLGLSVVRVGIGLTLPTAAQDLHQEGLLLATIIVFIFTGFLVSAIA